MGHLAHSYMYYTYYRTYNITMSTRKIFMIKKLVDACKFKLNHPFGPLFHIHDYFVISCWFQEHTTVFHHYYYILFQ